jgi:hypothetical protein
MASRRTRALARQQENLGSNGLDTKLMLREIEIYGTSAHFNLKRVLLLRPNRLLQSKR